MSDHLFRGDTPIDPVRPVRLCRNVQHKLHGNTMTMQQWFECMEKEPKVKLGNDEKVTWSGGLINLPSLEWLPWFGHACRGTQTTLVICESAAQSTLWRDLCGADHFSKVSRGSRRAGDGIVGHHPCPNMPSLVVATLDTVVRQLIQSNMSAMKTCHFDRIVMHVAQPDKFLNQCAADNLMSVLHKRWPHSRRWMVSAATWQAHHVAALFTFLRLRQCDAHFLSLEKPPLFFQMSAKCMEGLFKKACWNSSKHHSVLLNIVGIVPSDIERVLLTQNRQCEMDVKFYDDAPKLYLSKLRERFVMTSCLDEHKLRQHYGHELTQNLSTHVLHRLLKDPTPECCACLETVPWCATLVLPCCHTLCTVCHDNIAANFAMGKCPLCRQSVPDDPLLWSRRKPKSFINISSKRSWIRQQCKDHAQKNWVHIGGVKNDANTLAGENPSIVVWDTRLNTLHRAALAILANADMGSQNTVVHILLWQGFDNPTHVVNTLKSLLPDSWIPM